MHILGPRRFKHHQNSTRRHLERQKKKSEMVAGEGKKKSEILGGPAEGGPAEGGGGVLRKVVQGSPSQQQPQQP